MYLKTKKRCVALLALAFIFCASLAALAFSGEYTAFAFESGVFKNTEKNSYKSLDFEDENEIAGWSFDAATKSRSDSDWFAVETSDKYYHSGSKSGHFKKNALLENSWLSSSVRYTASTDANISYEVSAWVKTANSDPTALLTLYIESFKVGSEAGTKSQGEYTVMNTTATPTEWKELKIHTTLPADSSEFRVVFSIATGKAEFWLDDITVREFNEKTNDFNDEGKRIYLPKPLELDFHAKDENGNLEWNKSGEATLEQVTVDGVSVGKLTAAKEGCITKNIYVMQTNYSYRFCGKYAATSDGIIKIDAFDTRGKLVKTYKYALSKNENAFSVDVKDFVSATYSVFSIGFENGGELLFNNFTLYQIAEPAEKGTTSGGNASDFNEESEKLVSRIEDYNGVPTLTINGKPYSPIMYTRPEQKKYLPGCEETVSESGLELYSTRLNSQLGTFWTGKNKIDYTTFDNSVYDLIAVNDNAKILLCVSMFAPDWWMKLSENQDELVIQSKRDGTFTSPSVSKGASFASEKFRTESGEILKQLINHVKQQPYYNKIFAFQICAGDTYEWMVFDSGSISAAADYSKASENGFKNYLRKKYVTQANLRKAWHDETITFDTATIPTITERDPNGMGGKIFYDPQKNQRLIDFNLFLSDAGADTLLFYAEIVKTLTDNEKILGAFNGYMWAQAGSDANGKIHSSFNRLLNSEYIDFFASPLAYSERYLGQASTYMPMIDSILSHGKMYIAEIDHRTSLETSYSDNFQYGGGQGVSTGKTYMINETVLQYKRDIVQGLLNGVGMWFFDMRGNWLGDEQFYQTIYDMKKEYDYSYTFTEKSNLNEVAVIVGEETYAYSTLSGFNAVYHFNNYLYRMQRKSLNTMGAGYDTYSMGDLVDGKVPEHKVYIMLSPIEVTEEESAAIDKYIKKNNHTVVWVYACGYSNGVTLGTDNISALTGMTVKEVSISSIINVRISDKGNALTKGLNGIMYGNSTQGVNPLLYVDDNSVTKLGYYTDRTTYAGLAVKDMGDWTSIYSGAMNLPVGLLRNILKNAGVHIYSENSNDVIFTNANYVALYSGFGEQKTIKLDGYYAVYDVNKGEYYSMNTNEITFVHNAYDTALFRLSTPDKYRITIEVSGKGSVSGESTVEADKGGSYTADITAEEGYILDKVTINGEQVEIKNNKIELNNITSNAQIEVFFVLKTEENECGGKPHEWDKEHPIIVVKRSCGGIDEVVKYVCKVCGKESSEITLENTGVPGSHDFVTKTTRQATCVEKGLKQRICTKCGAVDWSYEIPTDKNNHEHILPVSGKSATCTENGIKDHLVCSDCKAKLLKDGDDYIIVTEKELVIKATGHDYENGVCKICNAADPDYVAPVDSSYVKPSDDNGGCFSDVKSVAILLPLLAIAVVILKKKQRFIKQ